MSVTQLREGRRLGLILGAGLVLLAGCGGGTQAPAEEPTAVQEEAAPEPGIDPVVSINAVMVALVDHSAHALWDVAMEENAPDSDEDWEELEYHAIQLAAAASWISEGGTGPLDAGWVQQPGWQEESQELANVAVQALGAVRSRNLQELIVIGDDITSTCENCHMMFKPDIPTEGITHSPARH